MNRIITKGLGPSNLLVTKGYGTSVLTKIWREVMRITSKVTMALHLSSPNREGSD